MMLFRMRAFGFVSLVFSLLLLSTTGCAKNLLVYRAHTLMFDEEGQPVHPNRSARVSPGKPGVPTSDQGIPAKINWFSSYPVESADEFRAQLDEVFDGLHASNKRKVLVFIHGGLNSTRGTLERQAELFGCTGGDCIGSEYYPVFINWRSSLWSSYRDRLFLVRQGERRRVVAPITSPLVFTRDLIGAVSNLPMAVTEQATDSQVVKFDGDWKRVSTSYRELGMDVNLGSDCRSTPQKARDVAKSVPLAPLKLVTLPVIDGFGQQAWRILLRRTRVLFEPEVGLDRFPGEDRAEGDGALAEFFRRLREEKRKDPDLELTIIGHSMGALVLNKALRHFGDLEFDNIVYMAAACSIEDYQNTMFGGAGEKGSEAGARGYLRRHSDTQLHHLMLQERAEVQESRWGWFEVVPRGSLLVWIDNFLEDPTYRLDRTVGRVYNLLREIERTPEDLRKQIHVKAFDFGSQAMPQPQMHGDFTKLPFWKESFWTSPEGLSSCP